MIQSGDLIFQVDEASLELICDIVQFMMSEFSITRDEAIGRLNRAWAPLGSISEDDLVHHESEKYWAYDIYYGKDSRWWQGTQGLEPMPFP